MKEMFAIAMAAIAWLITTTLMWFFTSLLVYIATDLTYKQSLTWEYQSVLVLFVYWWLPSLFIAFAVGEYCENRE